MRPRAGNLLSSLRYLLADFIGDDGGAAPAIPDGLPDNVHRAVQEGVVRLIDYQGTRYARLYVDRIRRFAGRRDLEPELYEEIARLMALRMSYEDPIRIAQLRLRGEDASGNPVSQDHVEDCQFRFDELVGALPAKVADPLLMILERVGWVRKRVTMRFSLASTWSTRRLRIEAGLRRWRLYSVRYKNERIWVERWLHMIDRSLVRQPAATSAVIQTATIVHAFGDVYRQGLADWHAIIDDLAKPVFDGAVQLPDLSAAIAQARAAASGDPKQAALKAAIARIRQSPQIAA